MNAPTLLPPGPVRTGAPVRAIRIAVLAMGGEGGGVLADWIVDLAEHAGHIAQLTSVPGVAQRTGATIYYVELFPQAVAEAVGMAPVLAMSPTPGDVDIVLASELMEAARAVQRGFVTPDRTTLIASTHRVYAIGEKVALADGRSDGGTLAEACRTAAKRFVGVDMAAIAERTGSVISAALFGALAGSGALPFEPRAFVETIARGGVGVAASQRAFEAASQAVTGRKDDAPADAPPVTIPTASPLADAARAFPEASRAVILAGVERLTDYQDEAYARLFLERLRPIAATGDAALLTETARYLALGMAYEDTARVAELKTRLSRFQRVRDETQARDDQIVEIAEYLHPRLQEIAESAPAWLGRAILGVAPLRKLVEALTSKGRVVKTTSVRGFLLLTVMARLKAFRRSSLRYAAEQNALEAWLALLAETAPHDPALARELAECRNLVKGYGDTHARGSASYATIVGLLPALRAEPQAALRVAALRKAALSDDTGAALRAASEAWTGQRTERGQPAATAPLR